MSKEIKDKEVLMAILNVKKYASNLRVRSSSFRKKHQIYRMPMMKLIPMLSLPHLSLIPSLDSTNTFNKENIWNLIHHFSGLNHLIINLLLP